MKGDRRNKMKKLVVILGMHRSGTSLLAQLCRCMGAYLGEEEELLGASLGNPDGHFENLEIMQINNNILRFCHKEWYSLEKIDPDDNSPQIKKETERIKDVMYKLFAKSNIAVIKEPRMSVLLPLWHKVLDELHIEIHYIWIFRNPLEVMESLQKRDGYSSKHGMLLWIHYNLSILKFLKEKEYILIHYKDLLEDFQVPEELCRLFGCNLETGLKRKFNDIIKREYCHSNYTYRDIQNKLLSDLYGALLKRQESEIDVSKIEKRYEKEIVRVESRYMDYEVLENRNCLEEKDIIIYGAGYHGRQAAEILQECGCLKYIFCDKDIHKQGKKLMNGKIISMRETEKRKNILVIIAVENAEIRREIEQTLLYIEGMRLLSYFALKTVWKYFVKDYTAAASKADLCSLWYEKLAWRGGSIKNACLCPVLVYQNGKVGSSTVSNSLWNMNIKNAHIHRFFFKNDIVGELILGRSQTEFIKKSNTFQSQSVEYVKTIKNEIKGKKIITLVREPVAVDLSTVFQWIGNGVADRYFAQYLRQGKEFPQIVFDLMVRIQGRMFDWFNEELKELCDIDVFRHPFDQEKGYTMISQNGVEVLLIKVEKLSQMAGVIGDFVGDHQFELVNANVGREKEYASIYREVKRRIRFSKTYIEHYYENNPYMDHFYSQEEQRLFLDKWLNSSKGSV